MPLFEQQRPSVPSFQTRDADGGFGRPEEDVLRPQVDIRLEDPASTVLHCSCLVFEGHELQQKTKVAKGAEKKSSLVSSTLIPSILSANKACDAH